MRSVFVALAAVAVVAVGGYLALAPAGDDSLTGQSVAGTPQMTFATPGAPMQNQKVALENILRGTPRGLRCAKDAARLHWTEAHLVRCAMSTR